MDRLSIILTLPVGAVICGALAILAFSLGLYSWPIVVGGLVLGYGLSWPVAYLISRRIKRQDKAFDHTRVESTGALPEQSAREV